MRSDRQGLLVALVAGALAAGCGSFVESNDQIMRATIGASGGALTLGSFSLDVPPHALLHDVTLSVSRASFEAPDGHAYAVDPPDTAFAAAVPVTITITYDAAAFPHPVEVFVATYTGAAWHALPAAGTPEAGAARATTTHTGTFGIMHCAGGVCPTASSDAGVDH
jgi:hypothetical protein